MEGSLCYNGRNFAGFGSTNSNSKVIAYYGPDQIDEESGEFCFVVWKSGKEVYRKTNSQLLAIAGEDSPQGMLIAGLSLYLNK
jgi:hypothetical protein